MPRRRKQQRSQLPLILIIAGVLLVLGVLIWAAVSGQPNTANTGSTANIQRVSLADAKAAFDQNAALFLDVRDADSYNISHIVGAVNIPLGELGSRLNELDRNQWIITYCT